MKTLITAIAAIFLPSFALADFKMDVTSAEIDRTNGHTLFADLAIGETGILFDGLCLIEGKLYVDATTPIVTEVFDFMLQTRATKLPGGSVSIRLTPPRNPTETYDHQEQLLKWINPRRTLDCTDRQKDSLMPVAEVNESEKASDLFQALNPSDP